MSPATAFWRAAAVTFIALGGLVVQATLADGAPPARCSAAVSYPVEDAAALAYSTTISCPGATSVTWQFSILRGRSYWATAYGSGSAAYVREPCNHRGRAVPFRGSLFITVRLRNGSTGFVTKTGPTYTWRCT